MRAVVQRVKKSELVIDNELYSKIEKGFVILLGITDTDNEDDVKAIAEKIIKLRVFEDENGKMNLALNDVNGEVQIVSQFTLYAGLNHGNRPSFVRAARPEYAIPLYEKFIEYFRENNFDVKTGVFGADMKVNLINDGPVTIIIESIDGKVI